MELFGIDLTALFDNGSVIVASLIAMVVAVANFVTIFVDESKVNKYVKPVLTVLNFLALNVFKNKNATAVKAENEAV
jgi:hypothetical protein